LLGFGVLESVGGGLNTWLRTGKLFPGPHLFAGAGALFCEPLILSFDFFFSPVNNQVLSNDLSIVKYILVDFKSGILPCQEGAANYVSARVIVYQVSQFSSSEL
jgi:hypothetical protein